MGKRPPPLPKRVTQTKSGTLVLAAVGEDRRKLQRSQIIGVVDQSGAETTEHRDIISREMTLDLTHDETAAALLQYQKLTYGDTLRVFGWRYSGYG
jgi:hypothetical protein